jgi:hypothetical protein
MYVDFSGVPMVIALIGAQLADNKDDVQRNPGRWDYYLDTLTKRDYEYVLSRCSLTWILLARSGVLVKALHYKPEGRGFETR